MASSCEKKRAEEKKRLPLRRLPKCTHPEKVGLRKEDGAVEGSTHPGFGSLGFPSSSLTSPPQSAFPNSNTISTSKESDRGPIGFSIKDNSRDQTLGLLHGAASKHGRSLHMPIPAVNEALPQGWRNEGMRRHGSPVALKLAEDQRLQQAKRVAIAQAQQAGATGNFKAFDSPFGNFLLPVIPIHFSSKPQGQP